MSRFRSRLTAALNAFVSRYRLRKVLGRAKEPFPFSHTEMREWELLPYSFRIDWYHPPESQGVSRRLGEVEHAARTD